MSSAATTGRKEIPKLKYGIIEVTKKCNFRCPGCYMVETGALNGGQMDLRQAINVLDLCRDYCGKELETMDILGGEPLLWPYLRDYIEELLRRDISPWIFTNMVAIKPELARWLFERNVKITGKLNVNPTKPDWYKTQAKMVGASDRIAKKMLDAIQIFLNAGYKHPNFFLENLIRRDNVDQVPGFYRWCLERRIGADIEMLACGDGITPEYQTLAATQEQLIEMIRQVRKIRAEFGITNGKVLMPHVTGACRFFDAGLYFGVDGHIRACSNSRTILANIKDTEPVKKAFESTLMCNRFALTQNKMSEPCGSCDRWSECRGGCRATMEGTGDPFAGYSICPVPHL